ncbi:MAG TPA: ATP-grasp domain-containing protein [Methylotenera sp.]|nr:ATP-grasp domain-containing protein [Methylotenera sp.]
MKILLLEYITAGGLNNAPLPASLLREGMLMRDALLQDFGLLEDVEIITTCDARINLPAQAPDAIWIDKKTNPMKIWQGLLQTCDAALIVAPETDGVLSELTQIIDASPAENLGCNQYAVDIASNKYAMFQALKNTNTLTMPTYRANELMESFVPDESFKHGYVVKPNDGAGCNDTFYFSDFAVLQDWLNLNPEKQAGYIIQPYQTGIPASISALCKDGKAWVLSCNQQKIAIKAIESNQAAIQYQGSVVNGLSNYQAAFATLANRMAKAIAGLNGYVGIDVIVDAGNIYTVEINPRITTSYIGLRESLNSNPAQWILDLIYHPSFKLPGNLANKTVEISVDGLSENKSSRHG